MVFVCDPLGDMLTRIRNAQMRSKTDVLVPFSQARGRVLHVLQAEGYILGYSVSKMDGDSPFFSVQLKYHNNRPVIRSIKRVSRPGRRVYASASDIPRVANGLGVTIVSTSRGVLSDNSAREKNVGGEVLCQVF